MDDATLHGCIPVIIMVGVLLNLLLALVPVLFGCMLSFICRCWQPPGGSRRAPSLTRLCLLRFCPLLAGQCARLL
jgi:hypothetical protein